MSAAITAAVVGVGATAYAADQSRKAGKEAANGALAAAGVSERQFDIANKLSANQRNIGNQALNALGARYGFTPAVGFGADYDPYSLAPDLTSRGVGKQIIGQADVRDLIKKGLSIDDILKIGILDPGTDGKKLKGLNIDPRDLQRLKSGTFSEQYLAANKPQQATGTGIPRQFQPVQPLPGGTGAAPAQAPGMVQPDDFIDTARLRELAGPVDTSLAAFEASPDYRFRLNEGLNAVQSSAAARGGLYSGNALRGITDYASGLASGEYNDFFNRRQVDRTNDVNRELTQLQLRRNFSDADFNRLGSLAGIGTTATQNLNALGAQTSSNIGNALIDAGNARASGIEGQANAINNGINQLGTLAGYYFGQPNARASGVNALAGGFNYGSMNPNQRFA